MSEKTAIAWTDATWNPAHGCTRASEGCRHCYAEIRAARFSAPGLPFAGLASFVGPPGHKQAHWSGEVRLVPDTLDLPLSWRKPRKVFVCSMSDLFHAAIPDAYIWRVFDTMVRASRHTFQILTKRSERLTALAPSLPWPRNIWAGVTVESGAYRDRLAHLRAVPAAVRFISAEPLLGPLLDLPLEGMGWVIVGGESGTGFRPMQPAWVRDIRDQCQAAGVPFFLKQWGSTNPKRAGRELDGRLWNEWPGTDGGH